MAEADITPLITAAEMFPALEDMALAAKREAFFSFRIFDADTELRSDAAAELGLRTWADLIRHLGERGVCVRLVLADFDPVFATALHRDAWASGHVFETHAKGDTAILLALHQARLSGFWKTIFAPKVRSRLAELKSDAPGSDTPALRAALKGRWNVFPATLHQKLAVFDGEAAIIGGLDVDERRFDDAEHDQQAKDTWHDVSLSVRGPMAGMIRNHFARTWNAALPDAAAFGVTAEPIEPQHDDTPVPGVRLLRTVSQPKGGALSFGPKNRLREHEDAYRELFSGASDWVYIETQFFRHRPLANALVRAAQDRTGLQCVLMLPTAPERIEFGGDRGIDARHAQYLQLTCLHRLQSAFGKRLALVSPAQPRRAEKGEPGTPLHRARSIYLHAKVCIVDGQHTVVGSANLNGRSMRWDTEASLWLDNPAFAADLHARLAEKWLPEDAGDPRRAQTWTDVANRNAAQPPELRQGYVLPYPMERIRRFSVYAPVLPSEMF